MTKNITVAFGGYNIKTFALLAVESFLLYYPELRENVVYFDDLSTDGTRQTLEKNGIKVISWSDVIYNKFLSYKERSFFNRETQETSARVCFIMRDIMEQTTTKYLMINDGDVVFKSGNFLEKYINKLENDANIIFRKEFSLYPESGSWIYKQGSVEAYNYYNKYIESIVTNEERYDISVEDIKNMKGSPRVHMLHMIMNLDYFKSINMLGDRLSDFNFSVMYGGLVDTGTDFYHQIIENNISYSLLSDNDVFDTIYHWGWLSSDNRILGANSNFNKRRNIINEISRKFKNEDLKNILNKLGMNPQEIIQSYLENK